MILYSFRRNLDFQLDFTEKGGNSNGLTIQQALYSALLIIIVQAGNEYTALLTYTNLALMAGLL